MKIFVIGLSRTGTKSVTKALNILGFKVVHYPIDEKLYHDLLDANYRFKILEKFDGISDITVVPYYEQLYESYPNSRFILTLRDKSSWLKSMQKHWEDKDDDTTQPGYNLHMKIRFFLRTAVYGCIKYSEQRLSYVYDTHHQNVLDFFRDKQNLLLKMNISEGDGWDKLCKFLDCSIPDSDFPHISN